MNSRYTHFIVLLGMSVFFGLMGFFAWKRGVVTGKYGKSVSRESDPTAFYIGLVAYAGVATILLLLAFYEVVGP